MSLIAVWLVSLNDNCIFYRRYFPINTIKSRYELFKRPLTNAEEKEFMDSLLAALGLTTCTLLSSDNDLLNHFDCTSVNQLPAIEIKLKKFKIWPLIVIEHKRILFTALPLLNTSSDQLIDHISISQTVFILQTLIGHFSKTNRLNHLEEYISQTMPFGSLIINPHLIKDVLKIKSPSMSNLNKQDFLILIKVNEFLSSAKVNKETIFGTVFIENNITPNEKCCLEIKLESIAYLNLILSPFCWLTCNDTMISIKMIHNAIKFFNYSLDLDKFKLDPFLSYQYKVTRKAENLFNLDLLITIQKQANIKFEYFNLYFINSNLKDLTKFNNCQLSQGQLQSDKNLGIVWSIGSKFPKNGQISFKCDVKCVRGLDNFLDAAASFKINHYNHGFPKIKSNLLSLKECQISNFKFSTQITMSTFDYRILATFQ